MVYCFDQSPRGFCDPKVRNPCLGGADVPEDSVSLGGGQNRRDSSISQALSDLSVLNMKNGHFLHFIQKFFPNKSLGPTSHPDTAPGFSGVAPVMLVSIPKL